MVDMVVGKLEEVHKVLPQTRQVFSNILAVIRVVQVMDLYTTEQRALIQLVVLVMAVQGMEEVIVLEEVEVGGMAVWAVMTIAQAQGALAM